ncbi:MAG: hypothetical protein AAF481_13675 [Acidobacteriota bacterium]
MNRRSMWIWVCLIAAALLVAAPLTAAPAERGAGAAFDQAGPEGHGWFSRILDWAVEQMDGASKADPPAPPAEDDTGATMDPDG